MTGFYETQVRRAMMTVGDADVLNEMATGWRASIRDLNTVDDRLTSGIRGLRDHDQLGERTRDAAVGAFRDMRDYIAEQRLMLGKTAQALDAAGGAITQVKSLIRAWDRAGVPVAPGPAPVPDPAASDQTAYWDAANAHQRASAGYAQQVQQREDEARAAWDSLNRVFSISEDKIRSAHGLPREEGPGTEPQPPQPVWPEPDWPGPPPKDPDPDWPQLPPWPPVSESPEPGPGRGPGTGLQPGPGAGPGPGPGLPPGTHPGPVPGTSSPHPEGSAHPGHHPQAPTTTVSGSSQSGVAYAPGSPGAMAAGAVAAPGSGVTAPMGMQGLAGAAGAAGASAGMAMRGGAGSAGAGAGAAGAAARSGASGRSAGGGTSARSGQTGQGGRGTRGGRGIVGGKGSQQASGQAKSGRGSAGAGGSRGGRRKDKADPPRNDLLATDDHWLDGEGTAPDVLR